MAGPTPSGSTIEALSGSVVAGLEHVAEAPRPEGRDPLRVVRVAPEGPVGRHAQHRTRADARGARCASSAGVRG